MTEQPKIIDDYRSSGDDAITIKDIVLGHIKSIGTLLRDDWHGGYWQDLAIGTAGGTMIIKKYVPDNREAFANAVGFLFDLLYPQFDEEMKEAAKDYEKHLEAKELADLTPEEKKIGVVDIHRKLFRDLQCFLYRENYLSVGWLEE